MNDATNNVGRRQKGSDGAKPRAKNLSEAEAGVPQDIDKSNPKKELSLSLYFELPRGIRFFSDLILGSALILILPLYWNSSGISPAYTLDTYVERDQTNTGLEMIRWAIYLEIAWFGLVSSIHSSYFVSRMISLFIRRSRDFIPKDSRRIFEFLSSCWIYLCHCFTSLALWITTFNIFTYPPPKVDKNDRILWTDQPWQYYFEKVNMVIFFFCIWRTLAKSLLSSISISVNRQVYQDRVYRCMFGIWLTKELRDVTEEAKAVPIWIKKSSKKNLKFKLSHMAPQRNPSFFPYSPSEAMSSFLLENIYSARSVSREMISDIFQYLKKEDSDVLVEDDLSPFVVPSQLYRAFSALDVGAHGNVTELEFIRAVDDIYHERYNLVQSVSGHNKLLKKLDGLFTLATAVMTFATCYFIFGIDPKSDASSFISTIVFTLLGKSVGDVLKSLVVSAIYVVNTHPFDVGDRVTIDGAHFFVRRVGLVSTCLDRVDGMKVYFSNYRLANLTIGNIRRITGQCSRLELTFDVDTPIAKVSVLRHRLGEFVKVQNRDFLDVQSIAVEMSDCEFVKLVIVLKHRDSQQNGSAWRMRNSKFLEQVKGICEELGINRVNLLRTVKVD
jgi:small-conductance mechanosensitive channel